MTQANVERLIGQLMTDEALRRRFERDPRGTLDDLRQYGMELNVCEREALLSTDMQQLARWAAKIDPRLQKTDLRGGT